MRVGKCAALLSLCYLLSFFAGCASFRSGNVPRSLSFPETERAQQESMSLNIYGAVILNGKIYRAHPKTMKNWRRQTIKAYEESGLFSGVRGNSTETDLHAEIMIVDRGEANAFLAFLTGLTLYVIPSKAADEFTVKTTISDREGNTVGVFEKSETVTLWQQLVLIVAMPFNWPASVAKEALYDLNHATIRDARAEGIF